MQSKEVTHGETVSLEIRFALTKLGQTAFGGVCIELNSYKEKPKYIMFSKIPSSNLEARKRMARNKVPHSLEKFSDWLHHQGSPAESVENYLKCIELESSAFGRESTCSTHVRLDHDVLSACRS